MASRTGHLGQRRAPHQTEVQQHRQAIALAAQQVGGGEVAVQQILAVQRGQNRQQLAQQQQHLAGAEHELALAPCLQQLGVGAAVLPFARQPELRFGLDQPTEARHLGMQHPLQPRPELAHPGLELGLIAPSWRSTTGVLPASWSLARQSTPWVPRASSVSRRYRSPIN